MNEQFNWVKNREEIDWGWMVEEKRIVSLFSPLLLTEMSHIYYFPWL